MIKNYSNEQNNFLEKYKTKIEELRLSTNEFAHLGSEIYLDHAANTIYMSSLINDFKEKLTNETNSSNWSLFSNPHSHSQSASYTQLYVDLTREKILQKLFNTSSNDYELIFVSNATQGLKLLAENFQFELECENETENNEENTSNFLYLHDNHTSAIGMREIVLANNPNTKVYCATEQENYSFNIKSISRPEKYRIKQLTKPKKSLIKYNLLIFPAQSNFNGRKYELNTKEKLIENFDKNNWYFCLDTASLLSTSSLDLSQNENRPDFLVLSFYKMFGFPTGLGALLVRKTPHHLRLMDKKSYFGGGNIQLALIDDNYVQFKNQSLHEMYEEGTISYLDIIGVSLAIDKFQKLTFDQGFRLISLYMGSLSNYFIEHISELKHYNGSKLVELYRHSNPHSEHGPIFSFNLKNSFQKYISFTLVEKLAQANRIHLRVGCFCNLGACQLNLKHLTNKKLVENFKLYKHKCGDHIDLIYSMPTGSIRLSFGYCTIKSDLDHFIKFLSDNFLEKCPIFSLSNPSQSKEKISKRKQYFKIKHLFIYPIKSCAPLKIKEKWPLKINDNGNPSGGFLYDRNWLIVDSNQVPLSQKRYAEFLTQLETEIDLKKNLMTLKFKQEIFDLQLYHVFGKQLVINQGNKTVKCYDEGDPVSAWLTKIFELKFECRLLRIIESKNEFTEEKLSSFNNKADFLLVNESSVQNLRSNLDKNNNSLLPDFTSQIDYFLSIQFRPNIIISVLNETDDEAKIANLEFDEEFWCSDLNLLNKNVVFKLIDNCTRCQMINIDQKFRETRSNETKSEAAIFSQYCSGLLKELYKLKSNSNFGVYLTNKLLVNEQIIDNQNKQGFVEKKLEEMKSCELEVGDIGFVEINCF
jgi:molybdenum cofactor sulfurtransferase